MNAVELHARDRYALKRTVHVSRRLPVRVDNTPLVDLALLLLTFFICATTMARPQVLEMRMPAQLVPQVDQPHTVTLYLRTDGLMRLRLDEGALSGVLSVRGVAEYMARVGRNGRSVAFTVKVSPGALHGQLVALLDALNRQADTRGSRRMSGYEILSMNHDELREVDAP